MENVITHALLCLLIGERLGYYLGLSSSSKKIGAKDSNENTSKTDTDLPGESDGA